MPSWKGLPSWAKESVWPVAPLCTTKVLYLVSVRLRTQRFNFSGPKLPSAWAPRVA